MTTTPAATTPTLRPASSSDLAAVERLLTQTGLPTAGVAEIFATSPGDFVVAEETPGGELLAVAGLEVSGEYALLRSVAVRPDRRQHGLGRELVRRLV